MTTGRAFHRAEDGTDTDITEGVQALYDLVISSMNWGSGFWSWEDALPVAQVGHLLGFAEIEEVDRYVADRKHEEERQRWINEHPEAHRRVNSGARLQEDGVPQSMFSHQQDVACGRVALTKRSNDAPNSYHGMVKSAEEWC